MSAKRDDAAAELIDKVVQHASGASRPHDSALGPDDLAGFIRQLYRRLPYEDLCGRSVVDLHAAAAAGLRAIAHREPGRPVVRVYNPDPVADGWQSPHTVVDIVTDDMPFLVDSVTAEISRHGLATHLLAHPILIVRRDADGHLEAVLPPSAEAPRTSAEAVMHLEIDRMGEEEQLAGLAVDLRRVLADVRLTVADWVPMRARAELIAAGLEAAGRAADPAELAEAADFLRWLAEDHFTFIGARDYALRRDGGRQLLEPVPGSGLGVLRETASGTSPVSPAELPAEAGHVTGDASVIRLTKSRSRSTVHRPIHFDHVAVKSYDRSGQVTGERRFLGLYTDDATRISPAEIPLLRRKVQEVVKRAAFTPRGHDFKALIEIINNYPRDELLQVSADELYETAMGILELQERPRVRLFVRRDEFGRYVSCLVYVPRDRHTTAVRERMTAILQQAMGGVGTDFTVRLTESPLARLHVVVYTDPDAPADWDLDEIEARLAGAARSWSDDLHQALLEAYGEEQGGRLARRYGNAYPAAYMEDYPASVGAADLAELDRLDPAGDLRMRLLPAQDDEPMRFKLYRSRHPITLSDALPVLESMGVTVVDERPYEMDMPDGSRLWVYDFGLGYQGELRTGHVQQKFADAFAAVWRGEAENDGFNRLVLAAELTWREVSVLRAFAKYLRQVGTAFSLGYMIEAVAAHPEIARLLVELFHQRFDPDRASAGDDRQEPATAGLAGGVERALDEVASLDEDRILRNFLQLTLTLLRTNYYQPDTDGSIKPYLSFKLDPSGVPDAPLPLPLFEIWVYSPRMEGVHLRGGPVARGGIRWSDRREDFRTEVLGLMKAQMVKNAVIVPVGSKGGFVVKRPPDSGDRQLVMAEGVECYRTLIRGMLDITDNLVSGAVVPPPQVVRHDGDDPYLVVAADKGTASFSDIANELSKDYGFWLGDAFASGGSAGYDHKRMGITAKGAWESVRRHFRELGLDTQSEELTVVGIGDMSGDVFGNGMLLSRHIRLVAAFDHRHVFLDPDPDPAASYAERARLFELPRSSWADYDPALISEGGGVHPRTAKSIPVSPQVRLALGMPDDAPAALSPAELMRAILRAPVDLLWNGGIGTYVKASTERDAEVGDRANDAIRVDAAELRCRVIGEGGNLGCTQRGRIEYARAGGRVNTDAIDNSAGVDTSDHEVNIKVLLDAAVAGGALTADDRDALLQQMTDEVAALVLRDNYDQTRAISNAVQQATEMLTVHRRYLTALERSGRLNRTLEFLPGDDELAERGKAGTGLTRPEFAVLLAYSKISCYDDLLHSDAPEDPYLSAELVRYFPKPLRERFADAMLRHPLRREIIATCLTNRLVNRAGSTFVYRMTEANGAQAADVVRAWTAAGNLLDLPSLWTELDALDLVVAAEVQTGMFLEARKLHDRVTRWLLRNRRAPLDIAATTSFFASGVATLGAKLRDLMPPSDVEEMGATLDRLVAAGVPEPVAAKVASCDYLDAGPDIVEAAHEADRPVEDVARVYFALDERLTLAWLHEQVAGLPRQGRWQTLARAAVRDDLYAVHAALTRDVLRVGGSGCGPDRCVEHWVDRNAKAVQRVTSVIQEIMATGVFDLATLSVALREVRSILSTTV
ncbi:MAG: NAD-glutamate dehydrogenase [Frankiaceae bacterium]